MKRFLMTAAAAAAMLIGSAAHAGPFILAGTDADDHGSFASGANQDGWFFMQRALENLAPGVTTGNKKVTILGSTSSSLTAASSAFNNSSLVALGWTLEVISTANFATFFGNANNDLGSGILMMDSGANIGGGVSGASFVPYATQIDEFLEAGGALFSQANGYQWLSTLLPGLTVTSQQSTGLALTAAGTAAFPGLTNSDLSAGPWHNYFNNVGSLPVLARSTDGRNRDVIIGSSSGSITNPGDPNGVPEPGSLALVGLALGGAVLLRRRKTA